MVLTDEQNLQSDFAPRKKENSFLYRIDCFSETATTVFGAKMKDQVEDRLKFYETGKPNVIKREEWIIMVFFQWKVDIKIQIQSYKRNLFKNGFAAHEV